MSIGTKRTGVKWPVRLAAMLNFCVFFAAFFTASANSIESNVSNRLNSQRCGDHIYFFFDDQSGKNIDPGDFQSIVINGGPAWKGNAARKGMKGFLLPTGCGFGEMKVVMTYQSKKMELILKRIPGDQGEIFLYSIPFSNGTYTFDFEGNLNKTCGDSVKGWHSECIISPERLKKVSDMNKQI
jgi:hypothetical protein